MLGQKGMTAVPIVVTGNGWGGRLSKGCHCSPATSWVTKLRTKVLTKGVAKLCGGGLVASAGAGALGDGRFVCIGGAPSFLCGAILGLCVGGGEAGVEAGELLHHGLVLVRLVGVHCLRMLTQVVETRELLATVAAEGPLSRVFSARNSQRRRRRRQQR